MTPTSYLEMIITFKSLLEEKRNEVRTNKNKYENGYEQIIKTEKKVEEMQQNLIELKPKLKIAAEETEIKMIKVEKESKEAEILKVEIEKEEAIVQAAVNESNDIKEDCQKDLEEAMPALLMAEKALQVLDKSEIDKVKSYKQPAIAIRLVMQACCLLLYNNPTEKRKNPDTL